MSFGSEMEANNNHGSVLKNFLTASKILIGPKVDLEKRSKKINQTDIKWWKKNISLL